MEQIQVQMFGSFSLACGEAVISDSNNRSKKMWSLLAYLLCHPGRVVSHKTLIDLLWGADSGSENPDNALRITLHRLRGMLDKLWPGAGRELVVHKDGGYCWLAECPVVSDSRQFEDLITADYTDDESRLSAYLQALNLYQGEFLPKHSSEFWVIPLSTHFHNLFLQVSMESAALLLERQRHDEALSVCRRATAAEPYHEPLYRLLMGVLGAKGDYAGAAKVYEDLAKRLSDDFGIQPGDETREIFRQAASPRREQVLPMEDVLEQLQDPDLEPGAMLCEYDAFKTLCRARCRVMERAGGEAHVALLSIAHPKGELPSRDIMAALEQQLQKNLRRGDVIARCSGSQFVVMLVDANFENSCMVCRRLLAAFAAKAPTVKVNYMVQELNTSLNMP